MRPWLTSGPAARVLALLNGDGEEARVVGGAVRNALLGMLVPGDIDIATTALPDEVIRRAKAAGIKSVPTGIEHGTVTLVIDGQPFEVTTLREDTETFGRKAKVAFGRDWVSDAERRDFTINGLSVDADGIVHDYVGGLADIAARRVRFIGDPDERIAEDYLRILRFFRIHAAYGAGEPDRDGYLACIRGRAGLASLSAERVRMEMLKLLVAPGAPARGHRDGGWRAAAGDHRRRHLYRAAGGHDRGRAHAWRSGERDAPARRARGRRDRRCQARRHAAAALQCRNQGAGFHGASLVAARRHGRGHGKAVALPARRGGYRDRLMLAWARAGGSRRCRLAGAGRAAAALERAEISAEAADFIARGIAEGPALGHVLTLAEDAWLAADFPLEASALAAIADQAVARFGRDHRL